MVIIVINDTQYPRTVQIMDEIETRFASIKPHLMGIMPDLEVLQDLVADLKKAAIEEIPKGVSVKSPLGNFVVRTQNKARSGRVDVTSIDLIERALRVGGAHAVKGLNIEYLAKECGPEGQAIVGEFNSLNAQHDKTSEKTAVFTDKTAYKVQTDLAREWGELMQRCNQAYEAGRSFSVSIKPEEGGAAAHLSAEQSNTQPSGM